MEKINKHNYEAYFLDFLEGNLSAEEKQDLFVFLDQHPELKKELDLDLTDVSLNPPAAIFENKQALKVEDEATLSLNSVDTWMLESVEKQLSASKQQELDDFIRKHQLEKVYTAYQSTILKPDQTIVFEGKEKLKVGTGIIIPLYLRVASIAAVGIVLIGVAMSRFGNDQQPLAIGAPENTQSYASKLEADVPHHTLAKISADQHRTHSTAGLKENQQHSQEEFEFLSPQEHLVKQESTPSEDSLPKTTILPDDVVEENKKEENVPPFLPDEEDNDVVITQFNSEFVPSIVTEEPYKLVTDAAGNFANREINFTREKNVATNEYVAFGFKIGNFEFERKKSE